MANEITRMWKVFLGKLNRLLDEAEDPQEQLAVLADDLNAQLAELRRSVVDAMTQEKRLRLDIEDKLTKGEEWHSRAVLALESGDEDLARQALVKKEQVEEQALAAQSAWESQKKLTAELQESLQASKQRVEETKRKYAQLVARHRSALAKKKIAEISDGQDSPEQLMDRLNTKILALEAESASRLEMSGHSLGDALESRFRELEMRQRGDQALAQLKATVGERPRLAPGSRVAELKAKLDGSS